MPPFFEEPPEDKVKCIMAKHKPKFLAIMSSDEKEEVQKEKIEVLLDELASKHQDVKKTTLRHHVALLLLGWLNEHAASREAPPVRARDMIRSLSDLSLRTDEGFKRSASI